MRTLDQYPVGLTERFGNYEMTRAEVLEFAGRFDPQPFHLDDHAAAANPIFGKLAASGWHTVAATMRMIVDQSEQYGGHSEGGAGVDELRWLRPVYPGDVLRAETEILEVRNSKSRPDTGLVRMKVSTFNQDDQLVMTMTPTIVVRTRAD